MAYRNARFYAKFALGALFVLILGIYSYSRAENLINGPEISLSEPANGLAVTSEQINLKGIARNAAFLTLNGLQIYTDENGNFGKTLLLSRGYNAITITAKDKFNRTITKTIELSYEPNPGASDSAVGTGTTSSPISTSSPLRLGT